MIVAKTSPDRPNKRLRPKTKSKTFSLFPVKMKTKTCKLTAFLAALLANSLAVHAAVRFLGEGHTDLAPDYDAGTGAWDFHVGSDTLGTEFPTNEVVLKVKGAAQ